MFDHFIITRFNLRNPAWDTTKNNETLLTEKWMQHRLWLFEHFCLPSLKAQSNQDFTWIIFLDTTTATHDKEKLIALTKDHANIELHFIDGMPLFYDSIKSTIAARSNTKEYIITTRIDNDDCIHIDFVATIQKQFQQQDYGVIDAISGYSLQVKPQVMLGKKGHIFNPFISLIEKNDNPKTVWFNSHNMWKKESNVTHLRKPRLWIAIIHDKNKINNFNGYGNIKWNSIKDKFVLSDEMSNFIAENEVPEHKWMKLSWKNFIIVNYKVYGKLFKKSLGIYKVKNKS